MATNGEEDEDMFLGYEYINENTTSLSQQSVESIRFASSEDESESDGIDYKVFNDPVHGHISLHPLLVKIIDTPQFQRLRNVKQLGATYFVYAGASHNRFEHCIGTSHLAGKLARIIQQKQPNLGVNDNDVLCVEMAGLCHDLGHGPFSHMFDELYLRRVRPDCTWTHEQGSCNMLDHLIEANDLRGDMQLYGITETDIRFVKEMIAGPLKKNTNPNAWPYEGRGENKSFLYEIVSNERNKVDVDKWDYFARDCHHLGIRNSFDHNRFMTFIKVMKVEGERLQICARDKECENLYEMFHTRSVLHRRAYQHRVSKAIDLMIGDAMVLAEPYVKIPGKDGTLKKISECIDDPVAYTQLNDGIFDRIAFSTELKLKPARDILSRVLRRQLYKRIGVIKPYKSSENANGDILSQIINSDVTKQLQKGDLVLSTKSVSYGMRDKNPIDMFKFYQKTNPKKPLHMRKSDVSTMLPDVFQESEAQVFCKDESKVEIAKKSFQEWRHKMNMQSKYSEISSHLTPYKRAQERNDSEITKRKKVKF